MAPFLRDQRIDRYQLLAPIAAGGMAEIWSAQRVGAAEHTVPCALKLLSAEGAQSSAMRDLFVKEANLSVDLRHPNLIKAQNKGNVGNVYFLEIELIEGKDLHQIIQMLPQALALHHAVYIIGEVLEALIFLHDNKQHGFDGPIIHRDVTPHNIMVSYQGEVKLADLGIAKINESGPGTRPGLIKGKPSYLSPEQLQNAVLDGRTDLFMLAATAYELLTREQAFHHFGPRDKLVPMRSLRPGIPESLAAWVQRSLRPNPLDRFQSAAEALQALQALPVWPAEPQRQTLGRVVFQAFNAGGTSIELQTMDIEPLGSGTTQVPAQRPWRRILPLALLGLLLLVLALYGAGYLLTRRVPPPPEPRPVKPPPRRSRRR